MLFGALMGLFAFKTAGLEPDPRPGWQCFLIALGTVGICYLERFSRFVKREGEKSKQGTCGDVGKVPSSSNEAPDG